MTPKEKAVELYNKTYQIVQSADKYSYLTRDEEKEVSKQLILIAVEEIDKAIDFDWMEVQNLDRQHHYWQQVKEEIEKL